MVYFATVLQRGKAAPRQRREIRRTGSPCYRDTFKVNHGGPVQRRTQPRGTGTAWGERRASSVLRDETGRTSAGAHRPYERPRNGISPRVHVFRLKSLLSSPALPLTTEQGTNAAGCTLQRTCHCEIKLKTCEC